MAKKGVTEDEDAIIEMKNQDEMQKYREDILKAEDNVSPEPPALKYNVERAKEEDHKLKRDYQEFQNGLPEKEARRVTEAVSKFNKENLSKTIIH